MIVRAKPWTYENNSNSNSCDGTNTTMPGFSGGNTDDFIQQLLDECGTLCEPCSGGTIDSDGDGIYDECDDCHNLLGDVNDDETHDVLDIVTIVNIILAGGVGSGDFTECTEIDADMDGNGTVNILDVILVINLILDNRVVSVDGIASAQITDNELLISSDVPFSGIQLAVDGLFNNFSIEGNDDVTLQWNVVNNKTHIIAYFADNSSFKNNEFKLFVDSNEQLQAEDVNIIVASQVGESIPVASVNSKIVNGFNLHSVYPNPFNPSASVTFEIPFDEVVSLHVLDINGKVVDTIHNGNLYAGEHSFVWNGNRFSFWRLLFSTEDEK